MFPLCSACAVSENETMKGPLILNLRTLHRLPLVDICRRWRRDPLIFRATGSERSVLGDCPTDMKHEARSLLHPCSKLHHSQRCHRHPEPCRGAAKPQLRGLWHDVGHENRGHRRHLFSWFMFFSKFHLSPMSHFEASSRCGHEDAPRDRVALAIILCPSSQLIFAQYPDLSTALFASSEARYCPIWRQKEHLTCTWSWELMWDEHQELHSVLSSSSAPISLSLCASWNQNCFAALAEN